MCAKVDAYTCGCMYMSVGKCFGKRKAEKVTWGMGKGLGAIFFGLCDMTCKVLVPGTGIKPVSPAMKAVLTTGLPWKFPCYYLKQNGLHQLGDE